MMHGPINVRFIVLMASTPSPRIIPEKVLFEHTWIQAEGLTQLINICRWALL